MVLTTFLVPFCVLASWKSIHERVKEFFILLLLLETAMIGVFIALDLFLFYFFWEATLIPMALIIGIYGHQRRVYAAVKFFLYTMIASVFMLAAIIWLYTQSGTFDFTELQHLLATGAIALPGHTALWLFLGFFFAFAVKVPLFPLHTWLPDAHVEAPTAGSVLLAGVLLKMGTYGLLRFNIGLFPAEAHKNAPWIITLAIIGIVYGALVALVQPNMKNWSPTRRSATLASWCWASTASPAQAWMAQSSRCSATASPPVRSSFFWAWLMTAATLTRSKSTAGSPHRCPSMPHSFCSLHWHP